MADQPASALGPKVFEAQQSGDEDTVYDILTQMSAGELSELAEAAEELGANARFVLAKKT